MQTPGRGQAAPVISFQVSRPEHAPDRQSFQARAVAFNEGHDMFSRHRHCPRHRYHRAKLPGNSLDHTRFHWTCQHRPDGAPMSAVTFPHPDKCRTEIVVDAWQLRSWEAYRDVSRLGRKTRIGGKQREILWSTFERVRAGIAERKLVTWADVFGHLTDELTAGSKTPFDHAVVDEAQDLGVAEARLLAALAATRPDGLFFAGDIGQRIFQQPFSWKELGLDVRGRSSTLRINYRTSHQIRQHADRLLPSTVADVDGNSESRRGTVSMFDGPAPAVQAFSSSEKEQEAVGKWIAEQINGGC